MSFDPQDYMLELKGKKYLPVAARVAWMRSRHPDWGVITEPHTLGEDYAIFRCKIIDGSGQVLATATKMEDRRGFPDFLEKAETGSVGRALALCGFGTIEGNDLDEGADSGEVVDSPVRSARASPRQRPLPPEIGASDYEMKERAARQERAVARIIAKSVEEGSLFPGLATPDGKLNLPALRNAALEIERQTGITDRIFTEDRPSLEQLERFANIIERYEQ